MKPAILVLGVLAAACLGGGFGLSLMPLSSSQTAGSAQGWAAVTLTAGVAFSSIDLILLLIYAAMRP